MRIVLVALMSVAALAACQSPQKRAAPMIANPASVNCMERGGQLIIRQSSAGQKGYCILRDGRSLDIWEYFRQTNG